MPKLRWMKSMVPTCLGKSAPNADRPLSLQRIPLLQSHHNSDLGVWMVNFECVFFLINKSMISTEVCEFILFEHESFLCGTTNHRIIRSTRSDYIRNTWCIEKGDLPPKITLLNPQWPICPKLRFCQMNGTSKRHAWKKNLDHKLKIHDHSKFNSRQNQRELMWPVHEHKNG